MSHGHVEEKKTSGKVCRAFKEEKHCFFKDPVNSKRIVITPKVKSEPKVSKSVLNEFIQKVASDLDRTVPLEDLDGSDNISLNIGKFNSEKFKISELSQVVKKKRNPSQLGLNQILYKVYKKCSRLMNYIYIYLKLC